jgi:hypothetical protein
VEELQVRAGCGSSQKAGIWLFSHSCGWVRSRGKGGHLMVATTNRRPPLPLLLTAALQRWLGNTNPPAWSLCDSAHVYERYSSVTLARGRAGRRYAGRRFVVTHHEELGVSPSRAASQRNATPATLFLLGHRMNIHIAQRCECHPLGAQGWRLACRQPQP